MNDTNKLNELWTTARDLEIEIDGAEDCYDTYILNACTVEENGNARAATAHELSFSMTSFLERLPMRAQNTGMKNVSKS